MKDQRLNEVEDDVIKKKAIEKFGREKYKLCFDVDQLIFIETFN